MDREILEKAKAAVANKNFPLAIEILTPIAQAGDPDAQFELGCLRFAGADYPASVSYQWLRRSAEQDHADACYRLASFHGSADFVLEQSEEEIKTLLLKAAELGSQDAQYALGSYYATGEPPWPKEPAQAAKWYQRAADNGHPDAQYNLGFMLLLGEGVTKNVDKALFYLERAARQESTDAGRLLAEVYQTGSRGVIQNIERANYWQEMLRR